MLQSDLTWCQDLVFQLGNSRPRYYSINAALADDIIMFKPPSQRQNNDQPRNYQTLLQPAQTGKCHLSDLNVIAK